MIFIDNYVLFAIPTWVFIAQILGTFIVAAGAAYIVTIPQPTPWAGQWALATTGRTPTGRRAAR